MVGIERPHGGMDRIPGNVNLAMGRIKTVLYNYFWIKGTIVYMPDTTVLGALDKPK